MVGEERITSVSTGSFASAGMMVTSVENVTSLGSEGRAWNRDGGLGGPVSPLRLEPGT